MKLKKVVSNEELSLKMTEAINLLCNTVKATLGPKGCNVIIDHSLFSPFITNDGVTIASNIVSDDPIINTILELAKEASIKTNDVVGDGTTTTLVLLQSIFNNASKLNNNPIILKDELKEAVSNIIEKIKENTIASNDPEIGQILSAASSKVGIDNIYLEETNQEQTTINHTTGYQIETILGSSYFLKSSLELVFPSPYILLTNETIMSEEQISSILNFIIENHHSLIIIAKDYDEYFLNSILNIYLENTANIILLKSPGYGLEELTFLEDLALISEGKIMSNNFMPANLGQVKQVVINKDVTTFSFTPSKKISNNLKEKAITNKRKGMLTKGLITINIGAPTTTEAREKKMRYEDALWAIKTAREGVLPGSGLILGKISHELKPQNPGEEILKKALLSPLTQILTNAGLPNTILNQIKDSNFTTIYNVKTNEFEDIANTSVVDPTQVVINSLNNATSIASMLLTTTSLVINEQVKPLAKEDIEL